MLRQLCKTRFSAVSWQITGSSAFVFVLISLFCLGSFLGATTTSFVYEGGNISSTLYNLPSITSRALEPGVMSVYVPHMEVIESIDLHYSMTAVGSCTMAEQQSFLLCSTNQRTESQVYNGSGNTSGTYQYNRTGLDLANGLFGNVSFELHAFRSSGGTGSSAEHNFVEGASWTITIHTVPMPMIPDFIDLYSYGEASDSITLSWTDSSDPPTLSWDLIWGGAGFDPLSQGNLVSNLTESGYLLSGLQPSTSYSYYVRRILPEGGFGDWFGPSGFRTLMADGFYAVSYSGEMSTTFDPAPTTSSRATDFSTILVEIPAGKVIDHVDLSYSMIARSGSSIADQRSFLLCATNSVTEPEVYSGAAAIPEGRCSYSRTGLSLANGLTGLVSFELHAFRTSGGSGSNADYNFVEDGSFAITIYYAELIAPSDLYVADTNYLSVVLGWEDNCSPPASSWDIIYGPLGFDPETGGTLVNAGSNPFHLSGLEAMTLYSWYVRSNRGSWGVSAWGGPNVFGTSSGDGAVLLYTAGNIPTTKVINPTRASRALEPGLMSLTVPYGKRIAGLDLEYTMTSQGAGVYFAYQRSFLRCATSNTTESQVYAGEGVGQGANLYQRSGLTIANGLSGVVDFELHAFRQYPGDGSNCDNVFVNNETWKLVFQFIDLPAFNRPIELTETNIGSSSAELNWTDTCYPEATSWDILYGIKDFNPGTEGTLISNVSARPYLLSGLSEMVEYDWVVRGNKGDLGVSEWSAVHRFMTLPEDGIVVFYNLGDIPTTYNLGSSPAIRAEQPGLLSVTIPDDKKISAVNIRYRISTNNGSWMSEQRSFLLCSTNGISENQLYHGVGDTGGVCDYSRNLLNIANGLSGTVDFELHVFRTWGGSGSNIDYQYVVNGTWQLIIDLEERFALEKPLGLAAENIDFDSAELSWIENCYPQATLWDISYGRPGFDPNTSGILLSDISARPYLLYGLADNTEYSWYVRAKKADLGVGEWSSPHTFVTDLNGEFFTYTSGNIYTTRIYPQEVALSDRAEAPGLMSVPVPAGKMIAKLDLSYSMTSELIEHMNEQRSFMLCSTNGVTEPQVYWGEGDGTGTYHYDRRGLTIATGLSGTVNFELHAFRTFWTSSNYVWVDNNSWQLAVSFTDHYPSGLNATNVDSDSADLSWSENCVPASTSWDLIYGPVGFDPANSGTLIENVDSTSYTLSGLSEGTAYSWYVRSRLSAGGVSYWAGPQAYVTLPEDGEIISYNLGNIPTTYNTAVSTSSRALQPGLIQVSVPAGKRIIGLDLIYNMSTNGGSWLSEQRSFLLCSNNGSTEAQVFSGIGDYNGTQIYFREGLSLANGLSGVVNFELHAFRIWGGSGSTTDYGYVADGTWKLVLHYADLPVALASPVTTISTVTGQPVISWSPVYNALSYKVYGSSDPYLSGPWTLLGTVPASIHSYTCSGTETLKFYRVVACSDLPARMGESGDVVEW